MEKKIEEKGPDMISASMDIMTLQTMRDALVVQEDVQNYISWLNGKYKYERILEIDAIIAKHKEEKEAKGDN